MNDGGVVETESCSSSSVPVDPTAMRKRRSFLPRFGLRTLLILGLVFCPFFGWLGMHVNDLRDERTAIEALKRAGATFGTVSGAEDIPGRFEDYDPFVRLSGGPDRPKLQYVSLTCVDADDPKANRAMEALAFFPEVTTIQLNGCAFDDTSLAHIALLPHVRSLSLHETEVTGTGVANLRATNIRGIVYSGGAITTELVNGIATLPCLDGVVIERSRPIEPLTYNGLERATRLKSLYIRDAGFDDEDVAAVATLKQLQELTLEGISDAGLEGLAAMSSLRKLTVRPPVTIDAAVKFSKSHPECVVENLGPRPTTYRAGQGRPHFDFYDGM